MQVERTVATVFIPPAEAPTLAARMAGMVETQIDHWTQMVDIRHHTDSGQRPMRVKVTVTVEDV